jgi:hypothetical protein
MSYRQINLDVFEGNPLPHVFSQPRIEPWYAWHQEFNRMPSNIGIWACRPFDLLPVSNALCAILYRCLNHHAAFFR